MFGVACPSCGQRFAYVESLEGQTVTCTTCQNQFVMQGGNVPSPPPLPVATQAVGSDSMPPIVTNRPASRLPRRGKPDNTLGIILACVAGAAMIIALGGFAMMSTESPASTASGGTAGPQLEAADVAVGAFGAIFLIVCVVIGFGIYIVPTIIAVSRNHPNMAAIIALNILLGWSFLGWVAALVWSFTEVRSRHNYHYHQHGP